MQSSRLLGDTQILRRVCQRCPFHHKPLTNVGEKLCNMPDNARRLLRLFAYRRQMIGNDTRAKFVLFKPHFLRQHHVAWRVDVLGLEAKT